MVEHFIWFSTYINGRGKWIEINGATPSLVLCIEPQQSKIHSNIWWNTLFDAMYWTYCVHQDTESERDKWDTLQNYSLYNQNCNGYI